MMMMMIIMMIMMMIMIMIMMMPLCEIFMIILKFIKIQIKSIDYNPFAHQSLGAMLSVPDYPRIHPVFIKILILTFCLVPL